MHYKMQHEMNYCVRLSTIKYLNNNIQVSKSSLTRVNEKRGRNTGQHTVRSYTITTDNHLVGVETRQNARLEWTKMSRQQSHD